MLPKKFQKMNQAEKEAYVVGKLQKLYEQELMLRRILAKVRGNQKFELAEMERLDLYDLKGEAN